MKDLYEVLYKYTDYGDMKIGRCPSYRILSHYIEWIKQPICDLGCGRGNLVKLLRDLNCKIDGFDMIRFEDFVIERDVTKPIDLTKYKTALCVDVFEHINDDNLKGLIENLKQVERQIITVSIDKSNDWIKGIDLHINIKGFPVWDYIIKENFDIVEMHNINDVQRIYLCERKGLNDKKIKKS